MFIISNLVYALAKVSGIVLDVFFWCIVIRALISWVNPDPYNQIVQLLYRITDPVFSWIRRIIPIGNFGIDITPLIACLIIVFLQSFVVRTLYQIAQSLQ